MSMDPTISFDLVVKFIVTYTNDWNQYIIRYTQRYIIYSSQNDYPVCYQLMKGTLWYIYTTKSAFICNNM